MPTVNAGGALEKMFKAAREGDEGVVSRLLGTNPELLETANKRGDVPLMVAVEHGQLGVYSSWCRGALT